MSDMVSLYGFGGGGTALNFRVVGGTTAPANPAENTIWVNTGITITGHYFQTEQPENMQPGEVWISTGTNNAVAFDALKKGTIMVYPISAKQMLEEALVDRTAKIYQNGEWVELAPRRMYLIKDGVIGSGVSFQTKNNGTVTQKDGRTLMATSGNNNCIIYAKIKNSGYNIMRIQTGRFENEQSYVNTTSKEVPTVRVTSIEPVLPETSHIKMENVIASAPLYSTLTTNVVSTGNLDLTIDISSAPEWLYPLVYIGGSSLFTDTKGKVAVINWWIERGDN